MTVQTMTKLAVSVATTAQATLQFNSIPQDYDDLVILLCARSTSTADWKDQLLIRFNNDSGTNYFIKTLDATGFGGLTSFSSDNQTSINRGVIPASLNFDSSFFSSNRYYINSYSKYSQKLVIGEEVKSYYDSTNSSQGYAQYRVGRWNQTVPITSITLSPGVGNFAAKSYATLYGIKNAATAAGNSIKASGGIIGFDGTYVTHTFNSSGTFIPFDNLLVDYLVVAGGGGGGGYNGGGGGGAGGLRSSVPSTGGSGSIESEIFVNSSMSYSITVGAGGAGSPTSTTGVSGSNSIFSTITSVGGGGGGGGGATLTAAASGGSGGGGGAGGAGGTASGGSASPSGQGFAGGSGQFGGSFRTAGGGGGAGAVGFNGNTSSANGAGAGGAGVFNNITGYSIAYAGGGGGGGDQASTVRASGGIGGGGLGGGNSSAGTAGQTNTGSGGGGGGGNVDGSRPGGSGIVIIRYKP